MSTLTPNEAKVGMPATMSIGSDSYATEVTAVYRFASGSRKGLVRAVETKKGLFTLRDNGRLIMGKHYYLSLGVAIDYWDPHF